MREEVTSGRLDAATSKAAVLQQLCDRLKFNPEAAGALHRSLYRQKMDDVLKNHNKITGRPDHPVPAGFLHMCLSLLTPVAFGMPGHAVLAGLSCLFVVTV